MEFSDCFHATSITRIFDLNVTKKIDHRYASSAAFRVKIHIQWFVDSKILYLPNLAMNEKLFYKRSYLLQQDL